MSASGLSRQRLDRLHDVMTGYVERGELPGLVTLVSRRGEVHVDAIGMKGLDDVWRPLRSRFKFYEKCLGGKIDAMVTFDSVPAETAMPANWRKKIMHARLGVGDQVLMGSDGQPGQPAEFKGFSVSVVVEDPRESDRASKRWRRTADHDADSADILRDAVRNAHRPVWRPLDDQLRTKHLTGD